MNEFQTYNPKAKNWQLIKNNRISRNSKEKFPGVPIKRTIIEPFEDEKIETVETVEAVETVETVEAVESKNKDKGLFSFLP